MNLNFSANMAGFCRDSHILLMVFISLHNNYKFSMLCTAFINLGKLSVSTYIYVVNTLKPIQQYGQIETTYNYGN